VPKKSKTFCVLPWMHLATNAGGSLRVCCNSIPDLNYIEKDNGKPYKIQRDDITEAWNSTTYKTIRQQMLDGERPAMCQRCFREEDSGLQSARQVWNEKWYDENKHYKVEADLDIKYVDIRLGNLCNLKCRMCNPYASNQWIKEWHLINTDLPEEEKNRLSSMNWPEDEKTWDNLFSIVDSVKEIYLTGGEPTIIKQQHKLLDYVIENNHAGKITLKYNTNLTNIPKHLLDKWKYFKKIKLNCSVDAYGELDRYIRYPSDFETIDKNLRKLKQIDNCVLEIHCTVQMYNILHLDKLINWAEEHNCPIFYNILNHPAELNIRNLPANLKKEAEQRLAGFDHKRLKGVIDYMYAEDWQYLSKFIQFTTSLDKSRNENIITHVPEFKEIFDNV